MRAFRIFFLLVLVGVLGWVSYTYLLPIIHVMRKGPDGQSDGTTGIALHQQGKHEEAVTYLQRAVSKGEVRPDTLLPLGRSLVELKRGREAQKYLERLVKTFSASGECEEALYLLGSIATDDAGRVAYWDELFERNYDSPWAETVAVSLADTHYASENMFEARAVYTRGLQGKISREEQDRIKEILTGINRELVFSKKPSPDSIVHTVKPGDILAKIAKRYGTTAGLIVMVNGLKKDKPTIFPDQTLKVLTVPTSIAVSIERKRLTVYIGKHWLKEYVVAVGAEGQETPVGTFKVTDMLVNPPWSRPGKPTLSFSHPDNILGTRWIGLTGPSAKTGYGIHGTTKPDTIGTAVTAGCVRMLNADVEEVYEMVVTGTKVEIQ